AFALPGAVAIAAAIPADPAPIGDLVPIARSAAVAEHPALIACDQELDRLLPIFREASEKLAAALDRFEQLRPALPDELVLTKPGDWRLLGHCSEREKDV